MKFKTFIYWMSVALCSKFLFFPYVIKPLIINHQSENISAPSVEMIQFTNGDSMPKAEWDQFVADNAAKEAAAKKATVKKKIAFKKKIIKPEIRSNSKPYTGDCITTWNDICRFKNGLQVTSYHR